MICYMCTVNKSKVLSSYKRTGVTSGVTGGVGDRAVGRVPPRAVPSLTVPGGQEFHFPHFFLKFRSILLIFPQTLIVVFLILALRVGDSPTR